MPLECTVCRDRSTGTGTGGLVGSEKSEERAKEGPRVRATSTEQRGIHSAGVSCDADVDCAPYTVFCTD